MIDKRQGYFFDSGSRSKQNGPLCLSDALVVEVDVDESVLVGALQCRRIVVLVGHAERDALHKLDENGRRVVAADAALRSARLVAAHGADELERHGRRRFAIKRDARHQPARFVEPHCNFADNAFINYYRLQFN